MVVRRVSGVGDEMVISSFTFQPFGLNLSVTTVGSGQVTSSDGTIACPSLCSYNYPGGTPVTLTATSYPGWSFSGWSGACSGTGPCVVTMTQAQSVTATFTQNTYPLTVSIAGSGTVTSTDGYINCGSVCAYDYLSGTVVTLNAAPAQGWNFTGWSGACSGTGSCVVTMTQAQSVSAMFNLNCPAEPAQNVPITSGETYYGPNCALSTTGDVDSFQFNASAGDTWRMVTAITSGGYPNNICLNLYAPGTPETPIFSGCSDTFYPPGILSVATTQKLSTAGLYTIVLGETLNATLGYALSLERLNPAPPDGIPLVLSHNIMGELAPPTAQDAFTFFGSTTGTYQITAGFASGGYPNNLCFDVYGPDGSVVVSGACTDSFYPPGTLSVQAKITPTQRGTYVVVLYAAGNDATINYNLEVSCYLGSCPLPAPLTVDKVGSGTVTSADGDIDCGSTCSYTYDSGTQVMLTATPDPGWTFTSWSGCDSINGNTCSVTMTGSRTVTATFTQLSYSLTVSTTGSGTVNSTDGFINCPSSCGHSYVSNTPVTLNATGTAGWAFAGWNGACTGMGSCDLIMTEDLSVGATFTQLSYTLTVTTIGNGAVTSTDGFIDCPGTCSHTYLSYTQVTLNATAGQGMDLSTAGTARALALVLVQ